jgi:hypothetical protein
MRQPPLSAVRCCAQQQHPPPAVMVQMWGLLLFLAARVVHAVQTPYLTLQDNLGEPSNLGFCIDLKGWPGQFTDAQLHSCKPTGGSAGGGSDQQFVPQDGAVVGRADAVGHCLQAQTASAGSHLDVPACDSTEPLQRFIWASGQLQLQNTGLCLAASTRSRQASCHGTCGSFVARNLWLQPCATTDTTLTTWRVVSGSSSGVVPPATGLPTCSTSAELTALSDQVTTVCCAEQCTGGLPTVCDAGCSAVLLPFRAACTAGYLSSMPMGSVIVSQINQAAALCTASGNSGGH